jgi:hypothetical protein
VRRKTLNNNKKKRITTNVRTFKQGKLKKKKKKKMTRKLVIHSKVFLRSIKLKRYGADLDVQMYQMRISINNGFPVMFKLKRCKSDKISNTLLNWKISAKNQIYIRRSNRLLLDGNLSPCTTNCL